MRRLMVLAIGGAVVGWAVNSLLRTDKDKPVSVVTGPPREKRAASDALRRNVISEASVPSNEEVNPDEAVFLDEQDVPLTDEAPPEQSNTIEEPENLILLEAFRRRGRQESETDDSPPSPLAQDGQARMKRVRNGVDQRLQRLSKRSDRRERGAA